MDQCKAYFVPVQHNVKFHSDDGSKEIYGIMYRQLVGSLNYLTTTKPDITYFASMLSQFLARPLESHWKAVKGVLKYLKGINNFFIKYTDSFYVELTNYSY